MIRPVAIGIDLGTTYSAMAIIDEYGQAQMLRNNDGALLTPSVVEFDEDGNAVVGEAARGQMAFNPNGVASEFKVHMADPDWKMFIGRRYDAMLISAYVLARLKRDAESWLKTPIDHAVVTVPAYFNHYQRLATKRAAEIAGFEILRLVNEPTAAAYDYAGENKSLESGNILVFDLGGGTLDATILQLDDGKYAVLATDGNHDLGGLDWDEIIVARISDAFLKERGKNIRDDKITMFDVKRKAEELKKALTRKMDVPVFVTAGQYQVQFQLTRHEFEDASAKLLERCESLVENVLDLAELEESDIDQVLLVGGATRMPMIQNLLTNYFSCDVVLSPHPDEAVARGAALVANREMSVRNLIPSGRGGVRLDITDVTSHSLGELLCVNMDDVIENDAEEELENVNIIPRFATLPAEGENVCTLRVGQKVVRTYVTEGETSDPEDCVTLDEFDFDLGREAGKGEQLITKFLYDTSGILTATVVDPKTGVEVERRIEPSSGMSDQELADARKLLKSVRID